MISPNFRLPFWLLTTLLVVACLGDSGCVTTKLWNATDPSKPIAISQYRTSQAELQRRGLSYKKDDHAGKFYVDQTPKQRLEDHAIRFLATPAAVCVDVASAAPILAVLWLDSFAHSDYVIQSGGHDHIALREARTPQP